MTQASEAGNSARDDRSSGTVLVAHNEEKRAAARARFDKDKKQAEDILSGTALTPTEMLKLAKRLAARKSIGLARRVLKRARSIVLNADEDRLEIFQKSALYTYKDPDLPLDWRLTEAFKILEAGDVLAKTESQESLGIAGAIYKRKWEVDGIRRNLERALFYYLRGYALGIRLDHFQHLPPEERPAALAEARADVVSHLRKDDACRLWAAEDRGYCGINAAFVFDVLASEAEREAESAGLTANGAKELREAARLIREEIRRSVPPLMAEQKWLSKEWWFYSTIGEAYFGLGFEDPANYDRALEWLVQKPRANGLVIGRRGALPIEGEVPEWEYESTTRQLAQLARLHGDKQREREFSHSPAGRALATFLGDDVAVESAYRGKFGLALSGGGFRASLFHIGVLAKLAELGVLPHVEALSCVSGGSIIGAHYYLELRHLLETVHDDAIEPRHYVEIIQRIEKDFLEGVQRNIRTRVLADWITNVKLLLLGYTRTLRVGELYERELYSRVKDVQVRGGERPSESRSPISGPRWLPDWLARMLGHHREPRYLSDLFIRPMSQDGTQQSDFEPRNHNWRRRNKAPALILNATALNTGHCWQFTASFMGESPAAISAMVDSSYRLRRMHYKDAPPPYRRFRLGHAVAASSCVPGLFEPLILDGLYPRNADKLGEGDQISVRLVDGGVCDNQGVSSLLEQDCNVVLVSDASGQMDAANVPSGGAFGVLMRTNSLFQARVRQSQYETLEARRRSSLLRGRMWIHLRQDLKGDNVSWKDCPSSLGKSDFESAQDQLDDATPYGVDRRVQSKLSMLRTDLDSFNTAEAWALMASGYRMTEKQFADGCVEGFVAPDDPPKWRFLAIESAMKPAPVGSEALRARLVRLLDAGANNAFKIWHLSGLLKATVWGALGVALITMTSFVYVHRTEPVISETWVAKMTFGHIGWLLIVAALLALASLVLRKVVGEKGATYVMHGLQWRDTRRNVAVGLVMSTVGFVLARLHLWFFDWWYLRKGAGEKFEG